ncbi:RNI-like protein [Basidiobolus meristosporus CBS 931.73]|uniref:RNI-like protein n=1 Tax=Basidiobolus meristosporus CBS 931.73 TaxID=1314790 RepID=A0A1Y1WD36_9FUNG|nr:RNI-like protein [Basidiobolus meristosporus CBS 931.73]|eukprot:ORX71054.1 RNI-like protein [Basidiobolus meristosporus CBS 931.73]
MVSLYPILSACTQLWNSTLFWVVNPLLNICEALLIGGLQESDFLAILNFANQLEPESTQRFRQKRLRKPHYKATLVSRTCLQFKESCSNVDNGSLPSHPQVSFRDLPSEILLHIFSMDESPIVLRNLMLVNKHTYQLVLPLLYKNPKIYYSNTHKSHFLTQSVWNTLTRPITSRFDSRGLPKNFPLERYGWLIQSINLTDGQELVTDATIKALACNCPNLKRINLSSCGNITDDSLTSLLETCSHTLESVNFNGCSRITDYGVSLIGLKCRKVESVNLAGCQEITDTTIHSISRGCRFLKQLRISDCNLVTSESIYALVQKCPQLQWLDIARIGTLNNTCVRAIADTCHELEWINLARPSFFQSLLPNPANNAILVEESDISDDTIHRLVTNCTRLQLLDISYVSSITNLSIESISDHASQLVCLTIIGCRQITAEALRSLAKLRKRTGRLGCITMGDSPNLSEENIEEITNEPEGLLSGWQKSAVDEGSLKEVLGGMSWDDVGSW